MVDGRERFAMDVVLVGLIVSGLVGFGLERAGQGRGRPPVAMARPRRVQRRLNRRSTLNVI